MKRCVIEASPEALRAILGLPEDAIIDGIGYSDRLGVLELRVAGFGDEVAEGQRLPRAITIVRIKEVDGEGWYQSAAQLVTQYKWSPTS